MRIFIDFDDVLLNTRSFIADYREIFRFNGISDEIFEKYYYDYPIRQKNGRLKKYDSGEHLRRIKEKEKIETKKLKKDIENLLAGISEYVFNDVENFLRKLGKNDLYLISYAKTIFQKDKIKNSGVAKHFREIVIIDELKAAAVGKILRKEKLRGNEPLYFLDDRIEQIENVKRKIPGVITIFIKRKEGRYNDKRNMYCDYEAKNLKEVLKIIIQK